MRRKRGLQRALSSHRYSKKEAEQNNKKNGRPASAMASLSSFHVFGAAEKRNEAGNGDVGTQSQELRSRPTIRPLSPDVETRQVRLKNRKNSVSRRRQPSQLTEDDVTGPLESPGTELRHIRENLRLNISKFRHDIEKHKARRNSPKKRNASPNHGRPPRRSDYSSTDRLYIDPDQLLRELNGQAAPVQLRAWSPKASQTADSFSPTQSASDM